MKTHYFLQTSSPSKIFFSLFCPIRFDSFQSCLITVTTWNPRTSCATNEQSRTFFSRNDHFVKLAKLVTVLVDHRVHSQVSLNEP